MAEQNIKTGTNSIDIAGVVKEQKLKAGKSENGKYINGNLVIKAGEFTEIRVKVMVSELTKNGNKNKTYSTLKSILDKQYSTLADGASEDEAVKVSIWGNSPFSPQLREEIYATEESHREGEAVTILSFDLGFGNVTIKDNLKPDDYKATFDIDVYIQKVEQEIKDNVPTGRAVVHGLIPTYKGSVIPVNIFGGKIEDEGEEIDFGQQLLTSVYEGITLNLFGNINYQSIIKKVKKGGKLGKVKIEEERQFIHELVAEGGDFITDTNLAFDTEAIKTAMVNREQDKEEAVKNFKKKDDNKTKTKGLAGTSSNSDINDDEIPF